MFVVLRIESPPEHMRGYIERFLYEIRTGLYVGTVSARVADELWKTINEFREGADVVMVNPTNNEAGFRTRATDDTSQWRLLDFDGVELSRFIPNPRHADIEVSKERLSDLS
jgi:CRISPR-associated protein Cas2